MHARYWHRPGDFGGPLPIPLCARNLASPDGALLLALRFTFDLRLLRLGKTCGYKEY